MALTFTISALQGYLSAYGEAFATGDYDTARANLRKARACRLGIPDNVQDSGKTVTLPNIQWFNDEEKVIDAAEAASGATDRRRLIRTGLRHGG